MAPSSSFLFTLFVTCETVRANYAYHVFHSYPQVSPALVAALSEGIKLSVALLFLSFHGRISFEPPSKSPLETSGSGSVLKTIFQYATPAALYLTNNLIYYMVLQHTTPSVLQVCMLMKLPTTSILHHYMISQQRNPYAWASLLCLCLGLILFNVPSRTSGSRNASAWYIAPSAGLTIAVLSALASISTEKMTKVGNFWASQACLYFFGLMFSVIAYPLIPTNSANLAEDAASSILPMSLLIIVTACTGFAVATVLRAKDNILKLIGTAASLITIAISQYIVLPELREQTFTFWKVLGGGTVCISLWTYNFYVQEPPENQAQWDASNLEKASSESTLFTPDATKIIACILIVGFMSMEVWRATTM
ncbi:hypothetical protein BP5796_11934 [Coleophoma crateriformis]|uniref:Uncharacterized protein n=1 Tax=Coleophoma crateriformis TaxID=565419 RepID=A0A3D8QBI3_9HELO|nr:hypothetical protein BP5796_11934 [Coleophoma crateriformis]